MKKFYLAILMIVFLFSITNSQEMISNFSSNGGNARYFVHRFDSTNYLINILRNNDLKVYKIISEDSIVNCSNRNFPGLTSFKYIEFINNFMLFMIEGNAIAYDLSNDMVYKYKIEDYEKFIKWEYIENEYAYINVTLNSGNRFIRFDYKIGVQKMDEIYNNAYDFKGKYCILYDYKTDERLQTYILYNTETKAQDTLITDSDMFSHFSFQIDDDNIWFQDKDGFLYSIDFQTKIRKKFPNVHSNIARSNTVKRYGDKLLIINSGDEGTNILSYDIKNDKIDKKTHSNFDHPIYEYIISSGKIIFFNYYYPSGVIIMDMYSGDYINHPSSFNTLTKFEIINDRYLINCNYEKFQFIDLVYNTTKSLSGDIYGAYGDIFKFVKFDNKVLVTTDSRYNRYNDNNIYLLNIDSKKQSIAHELKIARQGMDEYSKVISINNELVLISDNIYHVADDTLIKINKNPLLHLYRGKLNKFKTRNNVLYYLEQSLSGILINSYDGHEIKIVALLPNTISGFNTAPVQDFIVKEKEIYFVNSVYSLYKYNKTDNVLTFLNDHVLNIDILDVFLFENKGAIYFISDIAHSLNRITENGTVEIISIGLARHNKQILQINNRLFPVLEHGLYELTEERLKSLFPISETPCGIYGVIDDNKNENIMIPYYGGYHFDGNVFQRIDPNFKFNHISELRNSIFQINYSKYYDCNKKKTGSFKVKNYEYVFDIVFIENDTFLITIEYLENNYMMRIYKSQNEFQSLEIITQNTTDGLSSIEYLTFDNSGLLKFGNLFCFIDKNKTFNIIQNLFGTNERSNNYQTIAKKDQHLYFIACDLLKGSQLYRIKIEENVSVSNANTENVFLYPNPTNDFINIVQSNENIGTFNIINLSGQIVKSGHLNLNKISVEDLIPGVYYFIVLGNNEKSIPFIKI